MPAAPLPQTRVEAVRSWIRGVPKVIWLLIFLNALPEITLQCADAGFLGDPNWRQLAYSWGGFWPGLLDNWRPNFAGQTYTMFASYGFLHSGLLHLIVNMITLVSLGQVLIARIGTWRFLVLYVVSTIGGAVGFALLSAGVRPMVGASGALFGLIGAWVAWEYTDRFVAHKRLWPVARVVIMLVALNLALWWAMNGQLAWETHLGGFVTGWIMAGLLDPRARPWGNP